MEKNPILAYFSYNLQSETEIWLKSSLSMINNHAQVLTPSQGQRKDEKLVQMTQAQWFWSMQSIYVAKQQISTISRATHPHPSSFLCGPVSRALGALTAGWPDKCSHSLHGQVRWWNHWKASWLSGHISPHTELKPQVIIAPWGNYWLLNHLNGLIRIPGRIMVLNWLLNHLNGLIRIPGCKMVLKYHLCMLNLCVWTPALPPNPSLSSDAPLPSRSK